MRMSVMEMLNTKLSSFSKLLLGLDFGTVCVFFFFERGEFGFGNFLIDEFNFNNNELSR